MYTNTCLPVNEIFVSESLGTIGRHAEQLVTRRLGLVARYHSCEQKPVRAQELEDAFAAWLETCRPDERLERAARELLERGLRQRRIPASELDDRRRTKMLEDRLRRTGLVFRAGQMTEQEWQAETGAIRDDLARLKGRPQEPQTMRQATRRLTNLLAAWRDANPEQRAQLAASIVSEIQVTDARISAIRPRSAWVAYFACTSAHR